MIATDTIGIVQTDDGTATTYGQGSVTVTINGRTYQAITHVVAGTRVVTLDAGMLERDVTYDFAWPSRQLDIYVPPYVMPLWLKEQRRVPKQKRRVPSFKPGPHSSYRRGAY
jgi:hypothetical protein